MTTVAIANQKGGVAKTTSVQALGVAMAERGRKVLLVDLDPQASLTWACGIDPDALEVSIHDVLLKRAKVTEVLVVLDPPPPLASAEKTGRPGVLDLIPSTIDLAGAELHLLTKTGREYVLRKALAKVVDDYDVVLIDCPPSLGILTINGLTAADEVLIPLQCESLSQRGVGQLLDTIDDVRDYTNEDLQVRGAIATLFDGRTKLAHQVVEQVRREYGVDVLEPFVPKSVKVAEAPAKGRSILTHAPRSRSAEAYRELAALLLAKKVDDRDRAGSTSRDRAPPERPRGGVEADPQGRRALFEAPVSAAPPSAPARRARARRRCSPPAPARRARWW